VTDPTLHVVCVEVHVFVRKHEPETTAAAAPTDAPQGADGEANRPSSSPQGERAGGFTAPDGAGERATRAQHAALGALLRELTERERELGAGPTDWLEYARRTSGVRSRRDLTRRDARALLDELSLEGDRLLIELARNTEKANDAGVQPEEGAHT
jgi:hypothetical protein